jgi:2-polyprenyl-6-methoxyphenol hydroxylase-like FAD-dependent oxidoreductase
MPPSPQVLIVGAGPAGLALAAELSGFGISCQVVDKRTKRSQLSRACTVEPRTLELLDVRGRVGDLLAWGRECPHPPLGNEDGYLDYGLLDTSFPFSLSIPQARTEDALQAAAEKAGAVLLPGTEMTGLSQDDDGVDVELTGPEGPTTVRARYIVGCDWVNSTVRDTIGVRFDGWNYEQSLMMADARLSSPPEPAGYARITRRGMAALFPFRDGTYRVIVLDREKFTVPADEPLTLEDLSESCAAILGSDIGVHAPLWLSRFRSSQRHAKKYRVGRALLAGDAAHTHPVRRARAPGRYSGRVQPGLEAAGGTRRMGAARAARQLRGGAVPNRGGDAARDRPVLPLQDVRHSSRAGAAKGRDVVDADQAGAPAERAAPVGADAAPPGGRA